ncbi:MAG TPA: type II restriction endonuclease [Clostridia bacterium]|nr:type II restriction endonuclease [Clostridia bacterium]
MSSTASTSAAIQILISRWREDPDATYQTWFLWPERLKNFRSIRRGIEQVIAEIKSDRFGTAYRGSSLETVVKSIAEQRQIFKGADHPFLWKPKLRIPDIYESRANQLAFGQFLDTCMCCNTEAQLVSAVHRLDQQAIKGLGPAAANLMYFLHPTIMPPFNTAIVNGYNALTGAKVKLGNWGEYLAMRTGILRIVEEHRALLSNDLGAVGGLLFDIGQERYAPPPIGKDEQQRAKWESDLAIVRELSAKERKAADEAREGDRTHTEIQGWLRDLGRALGFAVWVAANDRSRTYLAGKLSDNCLTKLPVSVLGGGDAVALIDVIWFTSEGVPAAAFEVEHTTSIYSGIVRLLDLARGSDNEPAVPLFLVAPDNRESEVREQLRRPAFRMTTSNLRLRYLRYGELEKNREAISRFGSGLRPIELIAKDLTYCQYSGQRETS